MADLTLNVNGSVYKRDNDGTFYLNIGGYWMKPTMVPKLALSAINLYTPRTVQKTSSVPDVENGETYTSRATRDLGNSVIGGNARVNDADRMEAEQRMALGRSPLAELITASPVTTYMINRGYLKIMDLPREADLAKAPAQQASQPSVPKPGGLFSGDLRSLTARRNWVGEHEDYLRAQGWSDADIEGYQGLNLTNDLRASLNQRLAKQISGAADWEELDELKRKNSNMFALKPKKAVVEAQDVINNKITPGLHTISETLNTSIQKPQVETPVVKLDIDNEVNQPAVESVPQSAYTGLDRLKAARFQRTQDMMNKDMLLQRMLAGNPSSPISHSMANIYIGENYKGADRLRARKIINSQSTPAKKEGGDLNYQKIFK